MDHMTEGRPHFSTKEPACSDFKADCCTLNLSRSFAQCPGEDAGGRVMGWPDVKLHTDTHGTIALGGWRDGLAAISSVSTKTRV